MTDSGDRLKFRTQPNASKRQRLQGETLNLIYSQSRTSMIAHAILIPLMAFIYSRAVPMDWVWLWLGVTVTAVAWRLNLIIDYHTKPIYADDLPGWERSFVLSLFLVGLCWGLPGALFTSYLDEMDRLVSFLVIVGLSGGSMGTFGHHRLSHAAFSWPLVLPTALYWLSGGTAEGTVLGLSLLLYLLLTMRIVMGFQNSLYEAMATNYDRLADISGLTLATRRLDVANRALDERNAELAEKNALFSSLLDNSHVHMAYLDREFNFVFVNEAYAAAGHKPAAEFIGQNHFALYPDAENERIFRRVLETGEPYRADAKPFDHPGQPQQGTTYWDIDLLPIRHGNGEVHGLLLSLLDVTGRSQALQRLGEREEYLEAVFDAMHDGLCVSDQRGIIVGVTPSLCAMYGYAEADLIGQAITKLIGGHDQTRHGDYVEEHVQHQRKLLFKRVVVGQGVRRDGSNFPVEVSLTETTVGGRQLFVAAIRDVTEREAMIEKLEEALADLRHQKEKVQAANEELAFLSTHDTLTGLPNRRYFDDFSTRMWRQAQRRKEWLAILLIDIDHFKQYNDHYGHLAGDACLVRVASVLGQETSRAGDLAARYGGEEFIVFLGNTGIEGARHIAEAILQQVMEMAIPHPTSSHGVVTVSVGIAACVPEKGSRIEQLIGRADAALYAAKAAGRNRMELAEPAAEGDGSVG